MTTPQFTVVPSVEFEGPPLESEDAYLADDAFAKAVGELEPEWNWTASTMVDILRAFDDSGSLLPMLRVRLPDAYARYDYEYQFVPDDDRNKRWPEFERLRYAMYAGRRSFEDPARQHPLQSRIELAPYLEAGTATPATWSTWVIEVATHSLKQGVVLPITRTAVKSFYAPWQRLRAWALLESHTLRALLDPRALQPGGLGQSSYDFTNRLLSARYGDGRAAALLRELEADGWFTALYRARAQIEWAELRTHEPSYQFSPVATTMSLDERWDAERARLETRCERLAETWSRPSCTAPTWPAPTGPDVSGVLPPEFRCRIRAMLELWRWATDRDHDKFAKALAGDLAAVSTWAIFAFKSTFVENDDQVGALEDRNKTSLGLVLRPTRTKAARTAATYLDYITNQYNTHVHAPQLATGDVAALLKFLEENELWAWTLELAGLLEVERSPGDTLRDRRFLHLRSLALLNEQVFVRLAELFGTPADRELAGRGTAEGPLKMFLDGRTDWRGNLWSAVEQHRHLTRTNDAALTRTHAPPWVLTDTPEQRVSACMDAIQALTLPVQYDGAAKQVLLLWTLRNFGAHRFSRDSLLLHKYGGPMAGAAIFSALFYWKVASTMG